MSSHGPVDAEGLNYLAGMGKDDLAATVPHSTARKPSESTSKPNETSCWK